MLNRHRIHQSNLELHRNTSGPGLVGPRHSELISRLLARTNAPQQQPQQFDIRKNDNHTVDSRALRQKIEQLERQESNLKKEMQRLSEMTKTHKNSRLQMQSKYELLMEKYQKQEQELREVREKYKVASDLNEYLFKITDDALSVLPHYEQNCDSLKYYILSAKNKLNSNIQEHPIEVSNVVEDISQKLDSFRMEIDSMQNYQKKMRDSLSEVHRESKSISERLSHMNIIINSHDFQKFKNEINNIHDIFEPYVPTVESSSQLSARQRQLTLVGEQCSFTFFPENGPRINKIFSDVSMLFQQHIHLLEGQKMEYQFTKNKKLMVCQKYECEICQNYEQIISHTFSIVREAFKEIKFNFLREIKQIGDSSEIPILI